MIINQIEAARIQLHKAIELYEQQDYICATTLAGAAEEILGVLVRKHCGELPSSAEMVDTLKIAYPHSTEKELLREINATRNALKHATKGNAEHIEVSADEAAFMIMRGCLNYLSLNSEYTRAMKSFSGWFERKYGHYVK